MTTIRNPNQARFLRRITASGLGPASYASGSRPTLSFSGLRTIPSSGMVRLWAEGYEIEVVSISGNVVTYKALSAPAHTHVFTGDALGAHQHDLTTVTAVGGGVQLKRTAVNTLGANAAAKTNLNAVDAASAGTPAGTNANQTKAANSEVIDGTNLGAVTVYGEAYGL